jgi:hypothetical protein
MSPKVPMKRLKPSTNWPISSLRVKDDASAEVCAAFGEVLDSPAPRRQADAGRGSMRSITASPMRNER